MYSGFIQLRGFIKFDDVICFHIIGMLLLSPASKSCQKKADIQVFLLKKKKVIEMPIREVTIDQNI